MFASNVASWLIAIAGLLLVGVPFIMGSVLFCKLLLCAYFVVKSILNNVDIWFRPKRVYVPMSDGEVKNKFRELDNKENGYNPLRQDFALRQLFPREPIISQVRADAKKLFPQVDFESLKRSDVYVEAHCYFLRMLMERAVMIDKGLWDAEKENQWVKFRWRPKQMLELDEYFLDWHYKNNGQEDLVATRLAS